MANELSTKWTFPLTLVSQDKRVPLPGVMEGYAGELTGVDGSVQGGLRPFAGFKKVHELDFQDDAYHDKDSFVTDFFPVNFKIDFDSYAYGFVYRAQRIPGAATGKVTFPGVATRGGTLRVLSTDGTDRTYRVFDSNDVTTLSYSNGSSGFSELAFEFKQAAVESGTITLTSQDGWVRTYKGVADGSCTNGDMNSQGHVLFNIGGTELVSMDASEGSNEDWAFEVSEAPSSPTAGDAAIGEPISEGPESASPYDDTLFEVTHFHRKRRVSARSTLIMDDGTTSTLHGKTVTFVDAEDTPNAHTITFDNTVSKSSSGRGAESTLTQVEGTAGTLNGKTLIFEDAASKTSTITFDNTINRVAAGASSTVTQVTGTAATLNGKTVIFEDGGGVSHKVTFNSAVTQGNSTTSVAGVSGISTTESSLTSLNKSLGLAITAGLLNMTSSYSGGSTLTITMTAKDTTGNGKVLTGTAVSGSHVTATTFSGGNTGSTATKAGLADSDGTTGFALNSLQDSLTLAKAAGSLGITPEEVNISRATTSLTFGDTEWNDVNKGDLTLISGEGTTETYSIRNDFLASSIAAAEATFTFHPSNFNSVNLAELTLIDALGTPQVYRIRNDYGAITPYATTTFTFDASTFNDVNYATISLTDAAGLTKVYRARNDAGATTSPKAAATFEFSATDWNSKNNATVQLIDAEGGTKTYTAKNDFSADATLAQFNLGANATAAAANFIALVNSSDGHNNQITATNSGGVVTLVQDDATGASGNTTITSDTDFDLLCSTIPPDSFTGGDSIEFNTGANRTAAGANLEAAIEGSTGHNGTISVTSSTGTLVLTQATAGPTGNTSIDVNYNFPFNTLCSTNPDTVFTGGDTKEFNAGGNATAAAANLVALINASHTINASNSGGVVTLVQETVGSNGNTTITAGTSPAWNDNCSVNPSATFTRGGYYEFEAGANADTAAENFIVAVNTYHDGEISATRSGAVVTLTQAVGGAVGDTTVTKAGSFDSALESAVSNFSGGSVSTLVLNMDATGTPGNGKATTGTAITGGQTTQTAFAGGATGSSKTVAGISDSDETATFALGSLRSSLVLAIAAGDIKFKSGSQLGSIFDGRMHINMGKAGSAGQGLRITGTAPGTPSTSTITQVSTDPSAMDGKTLILNAPGVLANYTLTFSNSTYPASSTRGVIGIKGLSNKKDILLAVKRSIDKAIRVDTLNFIATSEPGTTTMVISSYDQDTLMNGKSISGTAISGGYLSAPNFSGGVAGTHMTAKPFTGGKDVTPDIEAAAEAASNLKEAIESKMGHNAATTATFTFSPSAWNSVNGGTINLLSSQNKSRTYTIKNDFSGDGLLDFEAGASATVAAQNFVIAVNSAAGHGGDILASNVGGVVTLEQIIPSTETLMERPITVGSSFNDACSVNVGANFVTATSTDNRFKVYLSTGEFGSDGDAPKIIITQLTADSTGNKGISFTHQFNSLSHIIPDRGITAKKFLGGGDVMFDRGTSASESRTNFNTTIGTAKGHGSSKITTSEALSGENPQAVLNQVTNGDAGNSPITIEDLGDVVIEPFSGGKGTEGDLFLDFYHSKCSVWSYGNLIRRGVSTDEVMDVASTGRVVVIGIRGVSPTTFYITEEECEASSSEASTTSDHCPGTAADAPNGNSPCMWDYTLVIETAPGPGIRPDLEGPINCNDRDEQTFLDNQGGNFNSSGTFVTPIPEDIKQPGDGTIVLCPSPIDEGFYTGISSAIPKNILDLPTSLLFNRSSQTAIDELGQEIISGGGILDSDGFVLTSGESYLPDPPTDSGTSPFIRLVPEEYPDIQSAYDASLEGDTILVGPGNYFPQPYGSSATISLQFYWTVAQTIFTNSSIFDVTNTEGKTSRFRFSKTDPNDADTAHALGTKRIEDDYATANWTFWTAPENKSTISLIDTPTGKVKTFEARPDGTVYNGQVDPNDEDLIFFNRGDSAADDAAKAIAAATNISAAINFGTDVVNMTATYLDEDLNPHPRVDLTQDTAGIAGNTNISASNSGSTSTGGSSFIRSCNPIPPTKFTGGTKDKGYYVDVGLTDQQTAKVAARQLFRVMREVQGETKIIPDLQDMGEDEAKWRVNMTQHLVGTSGNTSVVANIEVFPEVRFLNVTEGEGGEDSLVFFLEPHVLGDAVAATGATISLGPLAPDNGSKITLTNTDGSSFTFVFDNTTPYSSRTKNASGEYIVGMLDQGDSVTYPGQSLTQVTKALYELLEDMKTLTKIQPSREGNVITLNQSIPGGGASTLDLKTADPDDPDGDEITDTIAIAEWVAAETASDPDTTGSFHTPNGNTTPTESNDEGNNITLSAFSGGVSVLRKIEWDVATGRTGPQPTSMSFLTTNYTDNPEDEDGTTVYRPKNVTVRGRFGRKNTILNANRAAGLFVDTVDTNPNSPKAYRPFQPMMLLNYNNTSAGFLIEGLTIKQDGKTKPGGNEEDMLEVTGNSQALVFSDQRVYFRDCLFSDSLKFAFLSNGTWEDTEPTFDDCRFCANVGDATQPESNPGHHLYIPQGFVDAGENVYASTCTSEVLSDDDPIEPFFDISDHIFHMGLLPGGEFYPGYGNLEQSICLFNTTTIPEGERVDQLPILKGYVYLFEGAEIDNILFAFRMRKADANGNFSSASGGGWVNLANGVHLTLDNSSREYFSTGIDDSSWVTAREVPEEEDGLGGDITVFRDNASIPEENFVIEVDQNNLGDNIANATGYTIYLNIAQLWKHPLFPDTQKKAYAYGPGKYQIELAARGFNIEGEHTQIASTDTGFIQFQVEDNFCTFGDDDPADQTKDRLTIDEGDYVFAYELYDRKTGRRSGISEILQVSESDFDNFSAFDLDTSDPQTADEKRVYAILDLVYDSNKFDYAYIYRSVNTSNPTGAFSAGVLMLDGIIRLKDFHVLGFQPTNPAGGTTNYSRAAYTYKLGDVELVFQQTYGNDSTVFDEEMPYGGIMEWYESTLLISSINNTPASSSTEPFTQGDTNRGLGELRWSSMTERSPELFSPLNRYIPSVPSNEIVSLSKVGASVIGFSRDRMYHIRKDGGGNVGFFRVMELHEGFGVAAPFASDTVASTIYFLSTKGIKAVDSQGKLDDVRGFDYLITDEWASAGLANCTIAFDPLSSVMFIHNPDKEETACMWFNTARTSLLKDTNFSSIRRGPWVSTITDTSSDLVDRALFLQNNPTSATAQDGVTGYKPRVYVYDYNYSKTVVNSGGGYTGDRRLTLLDGQGDTRFKIKAESPTIVQVSGKSKFVVDDSSLKLSDEWVGAYIYITKSATSSLVGTKAKILQIENAEIDTYTTDGGTQNIITVEGEDFRSLAVGDRVGISPVYFRWIGHSLGMNSESGEKFAGIDFHRTRHMEGLGVSLTDVSGPPVSESGFTDNKYRALAFRGANLVPADTVEPTDLNGVITSSIIDGVSTNWAAFGSDSSALTLQGIYGITGPAITPGIEVFCPDLDFRLLSVLVTGKILSSDRTSRGTVE